MTIKVALGTSTPTSITVVATITSASPRAKATMAASFSADFIWPWSKAIRRSGNTVCCKVSAQTVAALMPRSSVSSTAGQTTKHWWPSATCLRMKALILAR